MSGATRFRDCEYDAAADSISGGAALRIRGRGVGAGIAAQRRGFVHPVVDVDRAAVSYRSSSGWSRPARNGSDEHPDGTPPIVGSGGARSHIRFAVAGDGEPERSFFETLHFAA
jgi:hypothetical protein